MYSVVTICYLRGSFGNIDFEKSIPFTYILSETFNVSVQEDLLRFVESTMFF